MAIDARHSLYTNDYYYYIGSFKELKAKVLSKILKKAFGADCKEKDIVALDIGCGSGELVYRLSRNCRYVYGLDYSENALSFSKKYINQFPDNIQNKISLLCADGSHLPFRDSSLDYIFSVDVFEHLRDAELKYLINEMHRVLKKHGRFFAFTSPNKEYVDIGYRYWIRPVNIILNPISRLICKKELMITNHYSDPTHINLHSIKSLQRLFRNSGFKTHIYTQWLTPDNFIGYVYKIISQLWPITLFCPLRNLFCPFLWVEGRK